MYKSEVISSWGKTSKKQIDFVEQIDESEVILPIGNLNSYGDSCIPKNKLAFKLRKQNIANTTVCEYIQDSNLRLLGIPGKSNVTIAGAIASDVHGKDNLWGGSFSKNIDKLELLIAKNKKIEVSRTENNELFLATIGGLGLTGVITDIEISKKLKKLPSFVETKVSKGAGFEDLFKSFKFQNSTYWSSWVDLIGKKTNGFPLHQKN